MDIKIDSISYEVMDVLSNILLEDCAVCQSHKLGKGNGERKIYLPGALDEKYRFFDSFTHDMVGFVTKDNLLQFLESAKKEYRRPTQSYREAKKLKSEYSELHSKISSSGTVLTFSFGKSKVTHTGLYINHNQSTERKRNKNWNLIGDVALPKYTTLSIIKLKRDGVIYYYFSLHFMKYRVTDDYVDAEEAAILARVESSKLAPAEKEAVILARVGQGSFRKKLLEEASYCPFTGIDDDRVLVASHIKPWKKSTNQEKRDPQNGFILSATFDKLFDRGLISFTDEKKLIISPFLSMYNREKLGISEGMLVDSLPDITDRRKRYLAYHRESVLKKMEAIL